MLEYNHTWMTQTRRAGPPASARDRPVFTAFLGGFRTTAIMRQTKNAHVAVSHFCTTDFGAVPASVHTILGPFFCLEGRLYVYALYGQNRSCQAVEVRRAGNFRLSAFWRRGAYRPI